MDTSCFRKKSKELKKNLLSKFTIPKLANKKFSLKSKRMNKVIEDSCKKPKDVEKGWFEVRSTLPFVSYTTHHDSVKVRAKLTKVMCR